MAEEPEIDRAESALNEIRRYVEAFWMLVGGESQRDARLVMEGVSAPLFAPGVGEGHRREHSIRYRDRPQVSVDGPRLTRQPLIEVHAEEALKEIKAM